MNALEALMRGMDEDEEGPARPLPEAQVMELRDLYDRYTKGCPFKPGDLATPRRGYSVRGAGEPHIVLEVRPDAEPAFHSENVGSNAYGCRQDMRVAALTPSGNYAAHWCESWEFAAYAD